MPHPGIHTKHDQGQEQKEKEYEALPPKYPGPATPPRKLNPLPPTRVTLMMPTTSYGDI